MATSPRIRPNYLAKLDRDSDGILDGDVPAPTLTITEVAGQTVLNWPYSAAGFELESAVSLITGTWTNVPDPIEIIGDQNYLTNAPSSGTRFYRLRR